MLVEDWLVQERLVGSCLGWAGKECWGKVSFGLSRSAMVCQGKFWQVWMKGGLNNGLQT